MRLFELFTRKKVGKMNTLELVDETLLKIRREVYRQKPKTFEEIDPCCLDERLSRDPSFRNRCLNLLEKKIGTKMKYDGNWNSPDEGAHFACPICGEDYHYANEKTKCGHEILPTDPEEKEIAKRIINAYMVLYSGF